MKINKYERRYKEYLALREEIDNLREQMRKRPPIPLKEPYQDGWILYIDFRDDFKRRKDYPVYKKILDMCAYSVRTKNLKLIKRIRSNRRLDLLYNEIHPAGGGRNKFGHVPYLKSIRESQYMKLNEQERSFFSIDPYYAKWSSFTGNYYYCTVLRHWLVVKTKPNIITHRYDVGGDLEKRYKELQSKLDNFHEFTTNYSTSYPAYKDRMRIRDKVQKFKKGEIEDITIEKIPRFYDW